MPARAASEPEIIERRERSRQGRARAGQVQRGPQARGCCCTRANRDRPGPAAHAQQCKSRLRKSGTLLHRCKSGFHNCAEALAPVQERFPQLCGGSCTGARASPQSRELDCTAAAASPQISGGSGAASYRVTAACERLCTTAGWARRLRAAAGSAFSTAPRDNVTSCEAGSSTQVAPWAATTWGPCTQGDVPGTPRLVQSSCKRPSGNTLPRSARPVAPLTIARCTLTGGASMASRPRVKSWCRTRAR